MSDKQLCFMDTNIWLYNLLEVEDESKKNLARRLINKNDILISTQVLNEVCINLLRRGGYTESAVKQFIAEIFSKYTVAETDRTILDKASEIREKYYLSYWDSLVVATAFCSGAKMIYSDTIKDGIIIENKMGTINPFKY